MNSKTILDCKSRKVLHLLLAVVWMVAAPAAFAVTITNEYWFDDNAYGSNLGTISDPFIATNQAQFDTNIIKLTNTPNVVIHLLPGTYRTAGSYAWKLTTGTRLLGSGMDVTTIKLQDNPGDGAFTIHAEGDRVHVEDLTVDVNGNTSSYSWAAGVWLWGQHCVVRRVKVINTIGTILGQHEVFGITIMGGLISECEVSSTLGDWTTGINIGPKGAVIEKCRVLLQTWSPTNISAAYNIGGSNVRLINNYSENGGNAVYQDTYDITNMVIANNVFKHSAWGVTLGPDHIDGVLIDNNVFALSPYMSSQQNGIYMVPRLSARNATIRGNIIRFADGLTGTNSVFAYVFSGVNGVTLNNNIWDSSFLGYTLSVTNIVLFNNHDLAGNLIVNANQVEPANGTYRRTIASGGTVYLTLSDKYVGVRANGTFLLPTALDRAGKEIIVSAEYASPSITISTVASQLINNSATAQTISNAYTSKRFISDGTNWFTY